MVDVSYCCPRCGAVAELDCDPYVADKSVTPFPLEEWSYVSPGDDYESEGAEGVRFVCGEGVVAWSHSPDSGGNDAPGYGEVFFLNFVRFENGEEVERSPESEYVRLAEGMGPEGPRGPTRPGFLR